MMSELKIVTLTPDDEYRDEFSMMNFQNENEKKKKREQECKKRTRMYLL